MPHLLDRTKNKAITQSLIFSATRFVSESEVSILFYGDTCVTFREHPTQNPLTALSRKRSIYFRCTAGLFYHRHRHDLRNLSDCFVIQTHKRFKIRTRQNQQIVGGVNFKSRSSEKFKGRLLNTYCVLTECIYALLLCMNIYV